MIQVAKIIGIAISTTGLIGTGAIGVMEFMHGIGAYMLILVFCTITLGALGLAMEVWAMPGVKCPKCAARGLEKWVLPGKNCPACGHPCFTIHITGAIVFLSLIIYLFAY